MSTHLNFYYFDFDRFISIIGSKNEGVAEQAVQIVGSRLRRYHALTESLSVCKEIIRQIVFEGKIPAQLDDLPAIALDDYEQNSAGYFSFEVHESILALLNKVGDIDEYRWMRYFDCRHFYEQVVSQYGLSQIQEQAWQFLLKGRALHNEAFTKEGLNYGYILRGEITPLLESLQPFVGSSAKWRSSTSLFRDPNLASVADQLYTILESYTVDDAFFDIA